MLTLLKTFFDIAILRKGPGALPPAWLIVYVGAGLWLSGIAVMAAVVPGLALGDMLTDIGGWAISILLFAIVIAGAGFSRRLPQGLGAIVGSGAIVLYAQVIAVGTLLPLAGKEIAGLALELLLIWSIFVKGRIVAATINVHPLVGVAISVIVYVLRFLASYAITPAG